MTLPPKFMENMNRADWRVEVLGSSGEDGGSILIQAAEGSPARGADAKRFLLGGFRFHQQCCV
jgi:hypothetical protein